MLLWLFLLELHQLQTLFFLALQLLRNIRSSFTFTHPYFAGFLVIGLSGNILIHNFLLFSCICVTAIRAASIWRDVIKPASKDFIPNVPLKADVLSGITFHSTFLLLCEILFFLAVTFLLLL